MINEAKALVLFNKDYEEAKEEYAQAYKAYNESEIVSRFNAANRVLKEREESMRYFRDDLLRCLKSHKLPLFIDLGEVGIFVSETQEIHIAPITNQE